MKAWTKVWLIYSTIGFIASLVITAVFDNYPALRLFSNEGAVFGIMFACMGSAIKKIAVTADTKKLTE